MISLSGFLLHISTQCLSTLVTFSSSPLISSNNSSVHLARLQTPPHPMALLHSRGHPTLLNSTLVHPWPLKLSLPSRFLDQLPPRLLLYHLVSPFHDSFSCASCFRVSEPRTFTYLFLFNTAGTGISSLVKSAAKRMVRLVDIWSDPKNKDRSEALDKSTVLVMMGNCERFPKPTYYTSTSLPSPLTSLSLHLILRGTASFGARGFTTPRNSCPREQSI